MIPPRSLVRDVHSLFTFSGGSDQSAVQINQGFLEKLGRLPAPDVQPRFINGILQVDQIARPKASTEIPSGGRIGNRFGPQRIEVGFVLTKQFEVFETGSSTEGVERQV